MDAKELFSKGNASFVNEDYEEALEFYKQALNIDATDSEIYSNLAQTYLKLKKYQDARDNASKSLELNPENSKALLRKGIACYYLKDYEIALENFNKGHSLKPGDKTFDTWIAKCQPFIKEKPVCNKSSPPNSTNLQTNEVSSTNSLDFMPISPKTKYDWYQTETDLIISILIKNIPDENVSVTADKNNVSITIKQSTSDYSLELELAHEINPDQIFVKAFKSKVEIKLKKCIGIRWEKLEKDHNTQALKIIDTVSNPTEVVKHYPSSSLNKTNWDKVVKDVEEEEKIDNKEGDAALNSLFQQIYADGSDEVKKAMNKSFQESGGTVLSTNWNEIAAGKVDVKPPDGMEYKSWEA